jgi:CRP/FNR family cyclic AMP-dependent transcriptional regulator
VRPRYPPLVSASPSAPDAFLARAALFEGLDEEALARVRAAGELRSLGPGTVVFEEGEPGFDLYVVKAGVLEVRKRQDGDPDGAGRVVNYLSVGECVGEMSLITGQPRSATVRVPQRAEILRVPGLAFERMLHADATIAVNLARILAYRLEVANQLHISSSPAQRHLSGDLAYFDLADVCQTLVNGKRTGTMSLVTSEIGGDVRLFFERGQVRHVSALRLAGQDAMLYVFRRPLEGSFEFESSETYPGPEDATDEIRIDPMGLILEGLRQRDELEAARARLGGRTRLRPGEALPWEDPAGPRPWRDEHEAALARALHAELARGDAIDAVLARRPEDELRAMQIVVALFEAGALV